MARPVMLSLLLHASLTRGAREDLVFELNVAQHAKVAGQSLTNRVDSPDKPSDLQLTFPDQLKGKWGKDEEAGMGSFGAVWAATAKTGACDDCVVDKEYAIKIFYHKEEGRKRGQLLTWATATREERKQLQGVSEECTLGKQLANLNGGDDEGRKYIMRCVEDFVGHRGRKADDVLFLVLEMGGTGMNKFWATHGSRLSVDHLKSVMRQSMEALAFLAAPGRGYGYVHHDLKSENMVLRGNSAGGLDAMLIDFGATLKSDVMSAAAESVSNTGAPPEWGRPNVAFESRYPFAFDTFCMANVFIELLAGQPLIEIYYTGSKKTYSDYDRTSWCRDKGADSNSCEFWHSLDVFWSYIRRRDLDSAAIIDVVQHRDSKASKEIQRHFFDQLLKSDPDFRDFLNVVASMFSYSARSRPSAQDVLQSAFLTGPSSKAVVVQVPQVKQHVVERLREPAQEQLKQPVQAFQPGARFESLGDGLCKNRNGQHMSNVVMYRDPEQDEVSPFKECQQWCLEDPGCFGYATGMDGSGRYSKYMCRIHTSNHKDYLEIGSGKGLVENTRGKGGGKWKAPGSFDYDDLEPIQGVISSDRPSTCFKKVVDHQNVMDAQPDAGIARPETVEDKQPSFPQAQHEVKSSPKISMKKESVATNVFAQGQGAFELVGVGMCKSTKEDDNMSNIYAETRTKYDKDWAKKCEQWCKTDGGCFGYAITDSSLGTMCRLHTKNYADYVETGFGRHKTPQTKGEGGNWQAPGSYDFLDVGEIAGVMPSGYTTNCFKKVQ